MPDTATVMASQPAPKATRRTARILLLIPAYNEAARLRPLIRKTREILPETEILVVDDGSSDATASEASAGGAWVARHPFNLGYGAALQTGYRFAVERQYELLLQMDADGQHDPLCLRGLLEPVAEGRADVAIGSRFLENGSYESPAARRIGSALFGTLASIITGKRITDPTSGFWAMNRNAFELCASDAFPHDYPDADVLITLHRAGLRTVEVPVRMFPRAGGPSMHGGLRPFYYVFKMTFSIFVELLRKRRSR
jgi:glycosyltransferase involved in cell wall biosynthesis